MGLQSISIRSMNNIDLLIILYKPDRNVLQITDKWWSKCENMLILQLVYPRVGQHFWNCPEMVVNIFILQHSDQAKKGMYQLNIYRLYFGQQRLETCWHSLFPASVFFGFSEVKLQYSFSCFVILQYFKNWWNVQQHIFIINCFIVVYENWNIYYSHFCKNLVFLIQPYDLFRVKM